MTTPLIIRLNEVIRKQKVQRAPKALRFIKNQVQRKKHLMPAQVLISKELNLKMWENGMQNIPKRLELELFEDEGKTTIYLKNGKELKEKIKEIENQKKQKEKKKTEEKKEETEKKTEKKEEKKESEQEKEKKLKEKKQKEKTAEKASMKRKTNK